MLAAHTTGTSQAIYDRHQAVFYGLLEHLRILEEQSDSEPTALVQFLMDELLPQVFGEEAHLYPPLHAHGTTTDTMSVDHEFIEAYVRRIERAAQRLRQTMAGDHASSREALRLELLRLGRQLEAILELHLAKEDHIYLPLMQHLSPEARQNVMAHEQERPDSATAQGGKQVMPLVKDMVDVRGLSPLASHARAFAAFGALQPGEAFILVSDHDPQPLQYELTFEFRGTLMWQPLGTGPDTWRVVIGKDRS